MTAISIVGTRKPSPSGLRTARRLANELAEAGLCIVSGMALGIDTAAHYGALESTAATAAVWATGLDVPYPRSNLPLAEKLVQQGLVITEMPLGTPPLRGYFPRRNRIVAGISEAVLVVEAAQRSGSLITAQLAVDQNRDVFAVPGPIERATSKGPHQLIKDGAALVESAEDVLNNIESMRSLPIKTHYKKDDSEQKRKQEQLAQLDRSASEIYALMDAEPRPFEHFACNSEIETEQLNRVLVDLELSGLIAASAGLYSRNE